MKSRKILRVITLLAVFLMLLIFLLMYGFHYKYLDIHKNTVWISDDQTIVMEDDGNGKATCTIGADEQKVLCVAVKADGHINNDLIIYPYEYIYDKGMYNPDEEQPKSFTPYEYWDLKFTGKSKFLITVKQTTYFEVGQEITFYLAD